jgi:hypothetical protein
MLVIVEGIDRVGKTTFCNMLKNAGFIYLKDGWNVFDLDATRQHGPFLAGLLKLDTAISYISNLLDQGHNVVVDRLHFTEYAYNNSQIISWKREEWSEKWHEIDARIAHLNPTLVMVYPTNLQRSSEEHGKSLDIIKDNFEIALSRSMIPVTSRVSTTYNNLFGTALVILSKAFKHEIYLASPFFNPEQVEREEYVKEVLKIGGVNVFSPKDNCFLPPNATHADQARVFKENYDAIDNSVAVVAITDGKDMGTIWEAGYAFAKGKPVIYFAETLGGNGFNLMLAQSGAKIFLSREDLCKANLLQLIFNLALNEFTPDWSYKGEIE